MQSFGFLLIVFLIFFQFFFSEFSFLSLDVDSTFQILDFSSQLLLMLQRLRLLNNFQLGLLKFEFENLWFETLNLLEFLVQ